MPAMRHRARPVIDPVEIGDAAEEGLAEAEALAVAPDVGVAAALPSALADVSAKTCGA